MALAWHIAALKRQDRLPPLRKLLIRDRRAARPGDWRRELAEAKAWVISTGGTVISKTDEAS